VLGLRDVELGLRDVELVLHDVIGFPPDVSDFMRMVNGDELPRGSRSASGRRLCVSPRFPTREKTNSWLVQKVTSDEKRVRQTLMCFATFPDEGVDELVARAEGDQ
jgi:hypothetical protein